MKKSAEVLATTAITMAAFLFGGTTAADGQGKKEGFYYYQGQKIGLTQEAGVISVGLYTGYELDENMILMTSAGAVEVSAKRHRNDVWVVRVDENLGPVDLDDFGVPAGRHWPPITLPNKKRLRDSTAQRDREAFSKLQSHGSTQWLYPAFRSNPTGTLMLPTPRIIIALSDELTREQLEDQLPPELRFYRSMLNSRHVVVELTQPGQDHPIDIANSLPSRFGWIEWAEPDFVQEWSRSSVPNDPLFNDQWHLQNTGQGYGSFAADARLPGAWDVERGDGSIRIAVIDDGVELNHPDLPVFENPGEVLNGLDDDGNGLVDDLNGWDFFDGDNDPNPILTGPGSHGTSVAGVAAGLGNNALGGSGACQNCPVLPIRIFGDGLIAGTSEVADAITYAGSMADILNNSWGGGAPSSAITSAIQAVAADGRGGLGAVVIAASGNDASGWLPVTVPGIPPGTWRYSFHYLKDSSESSGSDTVWLDNLVFPDGYLETFERCKWLPAGWVGSNEASWRPVDDDSRSSSKYGGHCSIQAGQITHNELATVTVIRSHSSGGDLQFQVWPSSETEIGEGPITTQCSDAFYVTVDDGVNLNPPYLVIGPICGTWSNQDRPLMYGAISYPSDLPEVISVGAATHRDRRSDYSQWGPGIDILCHSSGGLLGITTTDVTGPSGYSTGDYHSAFGGTSSAAPLCSGIAGLILSHESGLNAAEVRESMRNSARKIGPEPYPGGWNSLYGWGAVDASKVLDLPQGLFSDNFESGNTSVWSGAVP